MKGLKLPSISKTGVVSTGSKIKGIEYLSEKEVIVELRKDDSDIAIPGCSTRDKAGNVIAKVPYDYMTPAEKAEYENAVIQFGQHAGKTKKEANLL